MEYEYYKNPVTGNRIFKLKISEAEFINLLPLNPLDRLLFDECEKSDKASDKLLGLERVARLIEQGGSKSPLIPTSRTSHVKPNVST
ncbi:MAG TPA: hypothetical protein VEP90_28255 [Methylomirabilota bacterium]|nr:hypothetical protein [Methylomirabilota bacterium]